MKLSIIVPIYNVEKYITKCLESLSNQKMKDIEVILVNDGSTDSSESIIFDYLKNHKNINILYFKKENGGLSDARNFGIKRAIGKYITFIDSDDYIEEDLFINLEKYMEQDIDVIKFKMKTVDENGNILEKMDGPVFDKCTGEEAFEKLCTKDKYIYLYRRQFFIEKNFKYSVGMYHEDFGLTPMIIVNSRSFVSTNEYGYNYLKRENSITTLNNNEKNIKKAKDTLTQYDQMLKRIKKYNISKHTKDLIKRYYTNAVILKAKEIYGNEKEFNKYISEIKKRKMYKNIKLYNPKQLIKRFLLKFNIKLYLKMR